MKSKAGPSQPTAGLVIIGNEILSGRTQDTNTPHIALRLNDRGIQLMEVRVVPDIEGEIVTAVNALRERFDVVFTTGGIGPTHDDITADSIASAFGVGIEQNAEAMAMLKAHYKKLGHELTPARARMARIPVGATLIDNPVSGAPGFKIENVYVMAGVPGIMKGMLENILPTLPEGPKTLSVTIESYMAESEMADAFGKLQQQYSDVSMGSYPHKRDGIWGASLVLRCTDEKRLNEAADALKEILKKMHETGCVPDADV